MENALVQLFRLQLSEEEVPGACSLEERVARAPQKACAVDLHTIPTHACILFPVWTGYVTGHGHWEEKNERKTGSYS